MTTTTISLVCATDRNYAMPLALMLYSALVHLRPGVAVRIFILDDGLTEELRARVSRVVAGIAVPVSVQFVPVPACYDGYSLPAHIARITYARIDLPTLLPPDLARVIYLDCDMLVLADLTELWEADMDGKTLLAVRDYWVPNVSSDLSGVSTTWSILDIDPSAPYFNSGLLVVDLERWRQQHLSEKMKDYLSKYNDTQKYCDQDVLNAVTVDQWGALDLRWNVAVPILRHPEYINEPVGKLLGGDLRTLRKTARIAHFITARKPWKDMLLEPLSWRWWSYCRRCGWFSSWQAILEQARWVTVAVGRLGRRIAWRN